MTTIYSHPSDLLTAVGQNLGHTDWLDMEQERVNLFAEATGDHQWIHVDPQRAKEGPFGATIAHGYLTLSLANLFLPQLMEVQSVSMGVNYGCDRVRFPAPVPVGSRVRGSGERRESPGCRLLSRDARRRRSAERGARRSRGGRRTRPPLGG